MKNFVVALSGDSTGCIKNLLEKEPVRLVDLCYTTVEDICDLMPDIILLVVNKRGEGALSLCRELKKNRRTRPIPVIFITEMEEKVNEGLAFMCGCLDYISNASQEESLFKRLRAYGRLGRLEKATKRILNKLESA